MVEDFKTKSDLYIPASKPEHQPLSGMICLCIGCGFILLLAAALASVRYLAGG